MKKKVFHSSKIVFFALIVIAALTCLTTQAQVSTSSSLYQTIKKVYQQCKNNVCSLNYKASRVLEPGSMQIYPLEKNGVLYGAIETGIHRFYALEPGKPLYFTSRAKFSNVWKLENSTWRLIRSLSYDHQDTENGSPNLEDVSSMEAWLQQNKVPALAVGVIDHGKLQQIKVYGELDKGRPAAYNSIFNVASLTKTVTTMIALKLIISTL